MGLALEFGMQRQLHDVGDLLITDRRFTAAPRGYLTESNQPIFLKLTTLGQHGRRRYPDHLADLGIRHTIGSQQQHLSR